MSGNLEGHKANFETLKRAMLEGNAAMMDCFDRATGGPVAVVCAVNYEPDGGASFVPLAMLFSENPYERLSPPDPDGGYVEEA